MRPVAQVGATFAGYVLEEVLGRGGMSEVYRARNPRLGNAVALKLLDPELAKDELFRERFARESQIAASLDHPNVISIYDAGEAEGVPYIAMRYVDGGSLAELLARSPLPADKAVAVVAQVAGALDAAHLRGLIHRDVKPANILVDSHQSYDASPHVYLTDFGVAKHTLSRSGLTSTGQFVGTIDYVAPEQIEGKAVDQRTDVYSLGCVIYECLTGLKPFEKDTNVAVMYAHLLEPPPAVTAKRPELPAGLDAVVAKAMSKNPEARYASCGELAAAARAALAGAAAPATPATAIPVPPPTPVELPPFGTEVALPLPPPAPVIAETKPKPRQARSRPRIRRRSLTIAVVLAVVGVAAAAGAATLGGGSAGPTGVEASKTTIPTDEPTTSPRPELVKVPVVRGLALKQARRKLSQAGLAARVSARKHAKAAKGVVLAQGHRPNVKVRKRTTVGLLISLGPKPARSGGENGTAGTTTGQTNPNASTGQTTTGGSDGGTSPTTCYDRLGRPITCGSGGGSGGGGGEDHRTTPGRTCVDRLGRRYAC